MSIDKLASLIQIFDTVDSIDSALFSPRIFQKLVNAIRDPVKKEKILSILNSQD